MDVIGLSSSINLIIHPKCPIEEYAIMARSFLWFIPITPPTRAFSPAIRGIIDFDICLVKKTRIANGASFCHDDRTVQETQETEDITEGYQKWQGALPSFNNTAVIKITGIVDGRIE